MFDLDESVEQYVRRRLAEHLADSYMGVQMLKFPEDLRVYEHLLFDMRANVVIEIGVSSGGSTLWFRDRLHDLHRNGYIEAPMQVAIDINPNPGLPPDVTFLEADVRDPELPARVGAMLTPDARPFVIDDSLHTYDTTYAALEGFTAFVPLGGYFVVEDTCVDVERLRIQDDWPRGAAIALRDWLQQHPEFTARPELERYGVTCHPGGFLQRVNY
jgi:cephalosporin hydroxylase